MSPAPLENETPADDFLREGAAALFRDAAQGIAEQTDRLMSGLLGLEWIGMVVLACILSPQSWHGNLHTIHPHLLAAVGGGVAFIVPAILVARILPGSLVARHALAVAQMLVSVLLIDITGGRIETHFHVFGSLAFLAFYRDWRVLVTASLVTVIDHIARGIWWPEHVYGILTVSPFRWIEHAWWILFEDFVLILATRKSVSEMWATARREAQLQWAAGHDVLTLLPNRRMLQEYFDEWRAGGGRGAILFLDLDRFKQVNDTLGHKIGDVLLSRVARSLSAVLLPGERLCRVGGDEFVALIEDAATPEDAVAAASRILAAINRPFQIRRQQLVLSGSVGISLCPEHGTDLNTLQERADRAMYVAKGNGRNQCAVFSADVAHRERVLKQIGRDLYLAIPRGQMKVYFQPLLAASGEVTGFEALARWTHPGHGVISPSEFIPLAEKSGLIESIGEWVLAEACRQCAQWSRGSGKKIGVAVNVSALQFETDNFCDIVLQTLAEHDLDPHQLTIEITEGIVIRSLARAHRHLEALREAGVRVAIDDFGTGYSSLSYLSQLPADTVKLDHTFVQRDLANDAGIVGSIIELVHRLGLKVVAEGVETLSQRDRLTRMGCDAQQGYYFSPPMPAEEVGDFLDHGRAEIGEFAEPLVG